MKSAKVIETAAVAADRADVTPLSVFEKATLEAREDALWAGRLAEWWDEFWQKYTLKAAQGGKRI